MSEKYNRHLKFGSVINFRDIGGYAAGDGRTVAWRRVFRSGEFRNLTPEDLKRLTCELGVVSVMDLRSGHELENHGKGLLEGSPLKYCNIEFMTDDGGPTGNADRYAHCTNMGEFYLEMARQKDYGRHIVEALEVIADPKNHPMVFHCAVGKDRTGMLAAVLLSLLGVAEKDIVQDYTLSEPYMDELLARLKNNPKKDDPPLDIPDYFWKAGAESMKLFLNTIKREHGSVAQYVAAMGGKPDLAERLAKALLVKE
jgi:protein-tyrosine phosphatase